MSWQLWQELTKLDRRVRTRIFRGQVIILPRKYNIIQGGNYLQRTRWFTKDKLQKTRLSKKGRITCRDHVYLQRTRITIENKMTNAGQDFSHNTRITMEDTITKRGQAILHKTRWTIEDKITNRGQDNTRRRRVFTENNIIRLPTDCNVSYMWQCGRTNNRGQQRIFFYQKTIILFMVKQEDNDQLWFH